MSVSRRNRVANALGWLERLASGRAGAFVLFLAALVDYAVQAVAWPLRSGRDLDEYLLAYVQLFDRHVLLPWSLLFRTPLTPVFAGGVLDVAGGRFAELVMAILYAGSIVCWFAAARFFGARAALAVAVALLVYPGYALMFHELSSESVFAAAFSGWALLLTRAASQPTVARFALAGLGVAIVALVRPGNAVLLVFGLFALVAPGSWRVRLTHVVAFALAAILPLAAWSVHNGIRFDTYSLARGGNAIIPFYRAFITDNIISPSNGPQSRRLAAAMQSHLLTREPYRSYGVTLDELFERGSFRTHEDLYLLSDQVFGWNDDYRVLRGAGIEAVRAQPGAYASGVLSTIWDELSKAQFRVDTSHVDQSAPPSSKPETVVVKGRRLPAPTEGEPIPAGQVVWISRPDQSIRQVWTSPTEWHFVFRNPSDRPRFAAIQRETNDLFAALPHRAANAQLALRLNQLSRWIPRPWMWIALGLLGIAFRRPHGSVLLVTLALAALAVVLLNALGLFADLHFLLPVAPAFILLGAGGLLGTRAQVRNDSAA